MSVLSLIRRLIPARARRWLVRRTRRPAVGSITPADLRRTAPISRSFGGDRGQPVDRVFIERFLDAHRADIRGLVLEFGDDRYARAFGSDALRSVEVADVDVDNPRATLVADLATGSGMPDAAFDCIICTQTLQFIPDDSHAIHSLRRALRPGGVLLLTVPGISPVVVMDRNPWRDYRRYTTAGMQQLLGREFPAAQRQVESFGNVFAAVAFLHGLAAEELTAAELEVRDPSYPVIVGARAVAPEL